MPDNTPLSPPRPRTPPKKGPLAPEVKAARWAVTKLRGAVKMRWCVAWSRSGSSPDPARSVPAQAAWDRYFEEAKTKGGADDPEVQRWRRQHGVPEDGGFGDAPAPSASSSSESSHPMFNGRSFGGEGNAYGGRGGSGADGAPAAAAAAPGRASAAYDDDASTDSEGSIRE